MPEPRELSLLCRVGDVFCAIPLEHVGEVMRPMAVETIAGVPSFVRGLAVIRGAPIAVIDAASILTDHASHPTRFVTVKTGSRRIALAVDAVVGVVEISLITLGALPPLFQHPGTDAISAIGTMDGQLLLVLETARLMSKESWAVVERDCALA